jgi:hypothetical protein
VTWLTLLLIASVLMLLSLILYIVIKHALAEDPFNKNMGRLKRSGLHVKTGILIVGDRVAMVRKFEQELNK